MRFLATFACAVTVALAQHAAADGTKPREACRADVQRLCKGIEPGGGRIAKCMREHRTEISSDCRAALKAVRERRQSLKTKDI